MKVVFLINNCNIGGAQYVAHIQVKIAVQAGINVVVLAGTKGFFYDKMIRFGAEVHHAGHLNDPYSERNQKWIENYVRSADVVFNCVWLHMNYYIRKLKFQHKFKFLNVIHSNVDYAVNMVKQYGDIIDRQYVIHEKIKESLLRIRFPAEKIWVIHNVVDQENIVMKKPEHVAALRKKHKIKNGELVLGIVTRINTDKNILDTVRILYRLVYQEKRKAVLVIVGEPSQFKTSQIYYKKLLEYIKEKHLGSKVRLLGGMSTEDVYKIQPLFDIAINVSPSEGLPISLLEQMAAGLYCIYPGVGDIPGVLGLDGSRGKVIPIAQRKREMDIHKYFNYSDEEISLFVNHIKTITADEIENKGANAKKWIDSNRSYQEHTRQFIDFIGYNDKEINKELSSLDLHAPFTRGISEHMPLVSVLMTVKNTPIQWVKEAVWSVLSQTYKNWEFILVDDSGVTGDNSDYSRLVFELCQRHGITYVSTEGNLGVGPASNKGVSFCRGQWIARVDSDDVVMGIWLERQMRFIQQNPSARIVGCQLRAFGNADWVSSHKKRKDYKDVLAARKNPSWIINHGGVLIHKDALTKVGGYRSEPNRRGQDFDLWVDLLKLGYSLYTNPAVLYLYRIWKPTEIETWWKAYAETRIKELDVLKYKEEIKPEKLSDKNTLKKKIWQRN